MKTERSWLTPSLRKLGWISFWADVCSEMAYPVFPMLLASLGFPLWFLGLVEGCAEMTASLTKGLGGWAADRVGRRKPLIFGGYLISAIAKPLVVVSSFGGTILFSRILDRLGKGLRTAPRDAILADSVEKEYTGRAYGFHRTMDNFGAVGGIFITIWIMQAFPGHYKEIFLTAAIPGLLAAFIVLSIKTHTRTEPTKHSLLMVAKMPPESRKALMVVCLFALANSSDAFLIQFARVQFHSDTYAVMCYGLLNIVYAVSSYPAGWLSDHWGRLGMLQVGMVLFVITYLGFGLLPTGVFWILFMLYGVQVGMSRSVTAALAADFSPPDKRATVIGMFLTYAGISSLLGNIATGAIGDRYGLQAAFIASAGVGMLCTILAFFVLRKPKEPKLA